MEVPQVHVAELMVQAPSLVEFVEFEHPQKCLQVSAAKAIQLVALMSCNCTCVHRKASLTSLSSGHSQSQTLVETSRAEYLAAFRRLSTCRHKTPSQTAKNLLFTAFSNQSPKMSALVELALCDETHAKI